MRITLQETGETAMKPFGTRICVTDLKTGRRVVVAISDRGCSARFRNVNSGVVYVRADVLLPVGPGGATEIIVPNMDTYCWCLEMKTDFGRRSTSRCSWY